MRTDEQFSNFEGICMFTIAFLALIFSEVLPNLLRDMGPAAWIGQTLSGLLGFAYLGLFMLLYRRYKGLDFLQICDTVYGKVASKLVKTVLLVYLIAYAGTTLNQCVETVQVFAYADLSALKIDLLIMAAVAVMGLFSIKGMAKLISVFLPVIYIVIALILLTSYEQYDINLLNPILGNGVGSIGKYSVLLSTKFNAILILAIVGGCFATQKQFAKNAVWGIVISSALFIASTMCYCMAIPYTVSGDIAVGISGLAQNNSASRFFQRLESSYVAVDVMAILLLIGYCFLVIKKVYCNLFSISAERSRAVIVPLAALEMCIARTINNIPHLKQIVRYAVRRYSVFLCVGIILLTLLVSLIRRHGKRGWARAAAALLVPCMLLGLFSGCGHYHEPDVEIFPIVVGYDKGQKEKYRITMKFMTESKSSEGKDAEGGATSREGEVPDDVMVVETVSLAEGIQMMNSLLPREISLLHIKLIIISEELAREGVREAIEPAIRNSEIKPTMMFSVCKGSAYDMLASKNATLTAPVQSDIELLMETGKISTQFVPVTLSQFVFGYKSSYGDAMAVYSNLNQADYQKPPGKDEEEQKKQSPADKIAQTPAGADEGYLAGEVPAIGNRQVELAGMAVFKGDKMVGTLTTKECELLAFLKGSVDNTRIVFRDPHDQQAYLSLNVRRVQPVEVSAHVDEQGKAHIRIDLMYNALVGNAQNAKADYVRDPAQRQLLNDYSSEVMTKRCNELLKKLQTEYESDVLQLGRRVARNFLTISEWEAYNWSEQYAKAEINVNFQFYM